jgi:hypothetical protein
MQIYWNEDKNKQLQELRSISFEDLLSGRFLGIESNSKRLNQRLLIFDYQGYVWVVPYVQGDNSIFLKTAFKSRKHTKKYLGG